MRLRYISAEGLEQAAFMLYLAALRGRNGDLPSLVAYRPPFRPYLESN